MRSSCNGCRVLRKGCGENCTIRPCLEWIKTPESQAQATLFLAKFYGRTGLLNLIHAGPDYLRPAVFKSLLYEACGRIVSPIHGSVGLLWSGEWAKCQAAVEAVLAGTPIISDDADASHHSITLNSCDIRHVARESSNSANDDHSRHSGPMKPSHRADKQAPKRNKFKRTSANHRSLIAGSAEYSDSAETEGASVARRAERSRAEDDEVGLELTLGLA